jgi:hypothetical protein
MQLPTDINEYLRARASELAERILRTYPPLHGVDDPGSPLIDHLIRKPFPAQTLAMMGVVQRALAGGQDENSAIRAGGFHRALHAGIL